jgi:hypothetical protein
VRVFGEHASLAAVLRPLGGEVASDDEDERGDLGEVACLSNEPLNSD